MKDEIKEILDDLRKYVSEGGEHTLMEYEIKHIQCYITNLQEELEEEKRIEQASLDYITNLQDTLKDREEYCYGLETQLTNLQGKYEEADNDRHKLFEQKEKAIEYIKERYDYILKSDFLDHDEQVDKRQITYLLNILQGSDKE